LLILLRLLTRRFSVVLKRLGPGGGGGSRAGGGQGSGPAGAEGRIRSADAQRSGGPPRYMTVASRVPFPFAIDLVPNTLIAIVIKTNILSASAIMLLRRRC
jgi:hypothetical protein